MQGLDEPFGPALGTGNPTRNRSGVPAMGLGTNFYWSQL
jgi:hypothetical protein